MLVHILTTILLLLSLDSVQICNELLNWVILRYLFDCHVKLGTLLFKFISSDRLLDQRNVWGEIGFQF